jgi:hypothetical protein
MKGKKPSRKAEKKPDFEVDNIFPVMQDVYGL